MTHMLHGTPPAVKRVCFLFNHDQTHQLGHSLPIALTMLERGENEVVLAYSSPAIGAELQRLAGPLASRAQMVQLRLKSPVSRLLAATLDKLAPATKAMLYRDNLDFFRSFDAVVVSEKTTLMLKTRYGLDDVKLIHTRHGAGDRAIGFNRQSCLFDLVLVSGPKIRDRLITDAALSRNRLRSAAIRNSICARIAASSGLSPIPNFRWWSTIRIPRHGCRAGARMAMPCSRRSWIRIATTSCSRRMSCCSSGA